ncbi:hypothetical protein J6590_014802 [Homalodisca vitripennis]|nr:hypothetical protein J6590_014802 [Homalodisca vitripennis]
MIRVEIFLGLPPMLPMIQSLSTQKEPKKHVCELCGREYKQKCTLAFHLRYECGKEPQFFCELCPYKAKRKTSLNSHIVFKHKRVINK